jgi:hypothetical protein
LASGRDRVCAFWGDGGGEVMAVEGVGGEEAARRSVVLIVDVGRLVGDTAEKESRFALELVGWRVGTRCVLSRGIGDVRLLFANGVLIASP